MDCVARDVARGEAMTDGGDIVVVVFLAQSIADEEGSRGAGEVSAGDYGDVRDDVGGVDERRDARATDAAVRARETARERWIRYGVRRA